MKNDYFNSTKMDTKVLSVQQENPKLISYPRHGGWITFPFTIATMGGSSIAFGGWINNIIVYLIQEFNVKSISAVQVFNVFNGCTLIFPIVAAILADSYLGCFAVIWISSLIALLGTLILVLTAAIKNLRPSTCAIRTNLCESPTQVQYAILYTGLALASIGLAGTRYTIGPMGANQFDKQKHRDIFFNWYVCTMYTFMAISSTAIVYVEDNVSWTLGFSICVAANVFGLVVFLAGKRFYRDIKPTGSPFSRLGRVILAAFLKRKRLLSTKDVDYYQGPENEATIPTNFLSFLNRAALKIEPESQLQVKGWESCTVQETEELKSLIKLIPIWLTGLILCIPLVMQISLVTILALAMDQHVGPNFKIPAGSMSIFNMVSVVIGSIFIDRILIPLWEKTGRPGLTPLQRIGIGHALTIVSMALTAMVESRRLKITKLHNHSEPVTLTRMSVFWLVGPLAIVGFGEAFHFPGHVTFYYQEFPGSLKSTSTAIMAMFIGVAYYSGNVVMVVLRKTTDWLPDDINKGRLDNVFWTCSVIAAFNFVYYIVCAKLYNYQTKDNNTNHG